MNGSFLAVTPPSRGGPILLAAIVAALVLGLLAELAFGWLVGAAILALGLVFLARPFDLFVSLLLATAVSVFAEYGEHQLPRDLAVLMLFVLYATLCLIASHSSRRWGMPVSRLTASLLGMGAVTALAAVHGVAARNSIRFMGLEMLPLFGLFGALAGGGLRVSGSDLKAAGRTLTAVGLATAAIGFFYLALTGKRTQGLPFSPIPGIVALVLLNLTLYRPSPRPTAAPVVIITLLLLHQIISFTRGYWVALVVSIPFSCILYARRGDGARERWAKVGRTLGLVAALLLLCALCAVLWFGASDFLAALGSRLTSTVATQDSPGTVSNVARLVELRIAFGLIAASPWTGYGLGYSFLVRQYFFPVAAAQWWVHETYVMMWLKQGLLGLLVLVWLLFVALRLAMKGVSHPDPDRAGWSAAAAAATIFTATLGLTNYYFFMVTQNFLLGLLWGIALANRAPERLWLIWRAPAGASTAAAPLARAGATAEP